MVFLFNADVREERRRESLNGFGAPLKQRLNKKPNRLR